VFRPVISRVVPDGTAIPLSTMVEHEALDLLAEAALVKVQVVALSSSLAAAVGAGSAAGRADTILTPTSSKRMKSTVNEIILKTKEFIRMLNSKTLFRLSNKNK
jgi:hypothetical protein